VRNQREDYRVEKSLSLTYEEAGTLLEMAVCSYADTNEEVSNSALTKLGDLCRKLSKEEETEKVPAGRELSRAA